MPADGTTSCQASRRSDGTVPSHNRAGLDLDPATGPSRIFPAHAGQGFDLHECIRVLFDIALDDLPDVA
jgi:hypothetical protein